jgi:hypothetical protein
VNRPQVVTCVCDATLTEHYLGFDAFFEKSRSLLSRHALWTRFRRWARDGGASLKAAVFHWCVSPPMSRRNIRILIESMNLIG